MSSFGFRIDGQTDDGQTGGRLDGRTDGSRSNMIVGYDACRPLNDTDELVALSNFLYGFCELWCIWHGGAMRHTDAELARLRTARRLALEGFTYLSKHASEQHQCYNFKILPKFHKLDECIRRSLRTRLNVSWHWEFQDETFIGVMKRLARQCHPNSLSIRVVQRWLVFEHAGVVL